MNKKVVVGSATERFKNLGVTWKKHLLAMKNYEQMVFHCFLLVYRFSLFDQSNQLPL
jgi:hypothetical protein